MHGKQEAERRRERRPAVGGEGAEASDDKQESHSSGMGNDVL